MQINDFLAFEQSTQFLIDSVAFPYPDQKERLKKRLKYIDGRIGWNIFRSWDCFFDLPRSAIFIAKDMDGLRKVPQMSLNEFVQIPFDLEASGVTLSIETDIGVKKFILDTGASMCCIKKSLIKEEDFMEVCPGKQIYTSHKFVIGGHDFGKQNFILFEITDLTNCDGILGIDFFMQHAICLDFHHKIAYIGPFAAPKRTIYKRFTHWWQTVRS